jgi:hypothetical protein
MLYKVGKTIGAIMKVEIELTKLEELYIAQCCISRVIKSALEVLPNDYEFVLDMIDLSEIMEPVRFKLNDAIFRAKLEEHRAKQEKKGD